MPPRSSAQRTVSVFPFLRDERRDGVDHSSIMPRDVEVLERQRHLAGFDLRQIEDAVDQLEQVLAGGLDPLQIDDRLLRRSSSRLPPAAARCRG